MELWGRNFYCCTPSARNSSLLDSPPSSFLDSVTEKIGFGFFEGLETISKIRLPSLQHTWNDDWVGVATRFLLTDLNRYTIHDPVGFPAVDATISLVLPSLVSVVRPRLTRFIIQYIRADHLDRHYSAFGLVWREHNNIELRIKKRAVNGGDNSFEDINLALSLHGVSCESADRSCQTNEPGGHHRAVQRLCSFSWQVPTTSRFDSRWLRCLNLCRRPSCYSNVNWEPHDRCG